VIDTAGADDDDCTVSPRIVTKLSPVIEITEGRARKSPSNLRS
jgi:hypothetical protein